MQPVITAMLKVREAFIAAIIKSLLRTKSILQTILNIWISPVILNGQKIDIDSDGQKKIAAFLEEVERSFRDSTSQSRLVTLSNGLRKQFEESLLANPQCMLPSYNHLLPTGEECGSYLALDVGGSTFRVALIELSGPKGGQESKILKIRSFKIQSVVKQLEGVAFFDWMADRIKETLSGQDGINEVSITPLLMGLSWSFPIEQTSLRSGLLQGMGKGFLAVHGLLGKDLGDLIQDSCSRKGLNVELNAIVNDSSATLLSKAYHDSTTRFALILGTGVNAAVHLPVRIFSPSKFGVRPSSWTDSAKEVIVNTELSMFGAGVLPFTRWDEQLKATHSLPDFQPLEYFVSGGYLGEIVRLVLIEGIQMAGLFGGEVPPSLREMYSLDTETISLIESSTTLLGAHRLFTTRHPSIHPPSQADINAIRLIASHVTHRASSILAAGVHALWQMRNDSESIAAHESSHTIVAYNGSVLENYPRFKENCQEHLDRLVQASGGKAGVVELMYAPESSLLGAAVSVACLGR
ncbi:hypothetical protein B7494_g8413 [Chlorociboria aeruginascens]|nr:hypothetical protein B7494_g8413 [Chlorociboria aeruginascens]